MFLCDELAYYEPPCDEWAYTQTQSNRTAGHVQRGGTSSWALGRWWLGTTCHCPASRHISSPLARVVKSTDGRARPNRRQKRVKRKWRRRNADTGGHQKERHAANGTAKATFRVQGMVARVWSKIFFFTVMHLSTSSLFWIDALHWNQAKIFHKFFAGYA